MNDAIVILVNGEVLADGQGSSIPAQRDNAGFLAEALLPILAGNYRIAVLHGNKPQVGFVLFRSEVASHVLHPIPLDVCGADTQGATGYMLSLAFKNALRIQEVRRHVMCVVTQTLVDTSSPSASPNAIGPWFDWTKAEQYRQTRNWTMVEEAGRGYRRAVPAYPPLEILEMDGIQSLVEAGNIVIAAGGGGIPVTRAPDGGLIGIEAVIETEKVASLFAQKLGASRMLMVIEKDNKFILSGLSTETSTHLSLEQLDTMLGQESVNSFSVRRKLEAASEFLHRGGEQVVITTLRKLPETLRNRSGLRVGAAGPFIDL